MPILWFVMVMGTLVRFPGLVDLLKEVIGILYDDATFYGPKTAKRLMWGALAYIATLCFLAIFAASALAGQNAEWFAIAAFITAVMLLPLNSILNKAATAANMVLPTSMSIGTPKMLTLLILVVITSGLTALTFPNVLFTWYGFALLASMFLGLGVTIAFPSNRFLSRTVMGCVICAIFFLGVAKYGFPEYVEAFSNEAGSASLAQGRKNLQNKLALRPVQKIVAPKGASIWQVELLPNGDPKLRSDGLPEVKPVTDAFGVQKNLPNGTKFKTLDLKVRSVDVGEPVVQIFLEAPDGSWVQVGDVGNNWIAVSRTDLASAESDGNPSDSKKSTSGSTNGSSNASCVVSYSSGSCWTITPPNQKGPMSLPTDSQFSSAQVTISADGKSCIIIVPANTSEVLAKGFSLNLGERYEISADGSVLFSTEHPRSSASGLSGWRDPNVEGTHTDSVGGLEFGIGSFNGSKVVGNSYSGTADKTGIPVLRVVESTLGRKDGNKGGYVVTIKRL